MFKIMDKKWMESNLNLEMIAYNVMETGNKIGYIEFVDKADTMSAVHKKYGNVKGPFKVDSVLEYINDVLKSNKIPISRREYHENFIKSIAG